MEVLHNTNVEPNEQLLCNEIVLYDVLHKIFHYLNIYDLNHAAEVCKSWYHSAKMEKLKRGPQIMILQALDDLVATGFSNSRLIDKNELIDDLKASLRIKPSAGLFFTDGKYPASADCDSVSYEICTGYNWTQPDNCIYVAIETLGVTVNNKTINGERNTTAAVFLPSLPTVHYAITETTSQCIMQYFKGNETLLTNITDKLFSTDGNNICLVIFIYQWEKEPLYEHYHRHFLTRFFDVLKSRYTIDGYSLWGGIVNDIFTVIPDTRSSYNSTSFYAMSIIGSSVQSWSMVLKDNLLDIEIEIKLREFKKCIRLKQSIGFLIIPSHRDNADKSKTDMFRKVFPTIKLISIFSNKNNSVFSIDSLGKEINPKLQHSNSYAFMILNYKL